MNSPTKQERLLELLSDRALFGLGPEEQEELSRLQSAMPEMDDAEMDRIVALLECAPGTNPAPMLASMKNVILTASRQPSARATIKPSRSISYREVVFAMVAIASSLALAIALASRPSPSSRLDLAQRQERLLRESTDLLQVKWAPSDETKPYAGEVVWSSARQQGFMTFRNLPVNDPNVEQYQLWIFDQQQNADYPIDGGVFDVTGDDTVVEIDAKITVVQPTLFAITMEKPGGVVVSDRSRLPLLAKVN